MIAEWVEPGEGCRPVTMAARCLAVERAIVAMHGRLHDALSLHEMADAAHLSPYHFTRVFRHVVGASPGEFYTALRLQEAKRLLLTTDLSVTEVCFEVGYCSLGTFTTRFTQLVGLPPGRLRRIAGDVDAYLDVAYGAAPASPRPIPASRGLTGTIDAPDALTGLTFVGLFPRAIPQARPVACTRLGQPGPFHISGMPDGRYHLLAAALPASPAPEDLLLPGSNLWVGSAGPLVARSGRVGGPVNLRLRPPSLTDPPLVVALPALLADRSEPRLSA